MYILLKLKENIFPFFFRFARNFEIVVIECKVSKINISFLEKHISQNLVYCKQDVPAITYVIEYFDYDG